MLKRLPGGYGIAGFSMSVNLGAEGERRIRMGGGKATACMETCIH